MLPIAVTVIGALLTHPSGLAPRAYRRSTPRASHLDRSFVAEIAERVSPSVALVIPRGLRNSTHQGSGFAVEVGGALLLVTSAHVASGGMKVDVALASDGFIERHSATVVGRAPHGEDLALLQLDEVVASRLTPLVLGDSDALLPGDFLIAIGHPAGLRGAVTLGVLSGRGSLPSAHGVPAELDEDGPSSSCDGWEVPYLVTDASFAAGMSGGPLLNCDGEARAV
jgi:putative serine protease PepD